MEKKNERISDRKENENRVKFHAEETSAYA